MLQLSNVARENAPGKHIDLIGLLLITVSESFVLQLFQENRYTFKGVKFVNIVVFFRSYLEVA